MIRRNLRRLMARVDARRCGAKPDYRSFIRLAYELTQRGEPDEDDFRQHEADLARGLPHVDLLRDLVGDGVNASAQGVSSATPRLSARVLPEDADHLIHLAFRSLLRRDADAETYAAYREAFNGGTTFLDLVNDITESEEFKTVDERITHLFSVSNEPPSPAMEHPIASDMDAALTLLETRLIEKGCRLQLSATPKGAIDAASAHKRMRSLLVTLSLMDRL